MKSHQYTVRLDQRGRVVLPLYILSQLRLRKTDNLILTIESDGVIKLISPKEAARRGHGILRQLVPSVADTWRKN